MMRQITIIAPLLFLLLFVLYFFTPDFAPRIEAESFVDQDVLLMITQQDLEKRIDEFTASPLGLSIDAIDFQEIAAELNFFSFNGEKISALKENIKKAMQDPLLKIIFGREVTLAINSFKPDYSLSFEQQITDNILLIGRPKHPAKLIDQLTKLVPQREKISEARYGGHVIKRFPLDQMRTISAARVKDLFIFSGNERLLRRSLDRYDNGGKDSLAQRADFAKNKSEFLHASLFCYINIEKIFQSASRTFENLAPQEQNRVTSEIEKFKGYKSGFFGAWKEQGKIVEKGMIGFDLQAISNKTARRISSTQSQADTLHRLADETLLYYWNSRLDIDMFLETINLLGGRAGSESSEDIVHQISSITGLQPEEIGALAENAMSLAVKGIPEQQFLPIPDFMLVIQVHDQEKMQTALTRLIEHYGIPVRRHKILSVEALSWGGVMGATSLQPTMVFVGDFLLLSSNQEQIKEFIALPEGKISLEQGSHFKSLENTLSGENHSVVFLNFAEITSMCKELVSWGGTMIAIKDREVARKSKLLIDRLINPLLDGLAMYSVIGMRKYVEEDNIIFESTTVVEYGQK